MINHSIISPTVYQAFFNGGINVKFEDYLQRAEFISLQNFLKTGGEIYIQSPQKTYSEQLKEVHQKAKAFFDQKFTDIDEHDKITECFYNLAGVYEEVFFEVGTIVGAKIGMQLQKKLQELQ